MAIDSDQRDKNTTNKEKYNYSSGYVAGRGGNYGRVPQGGRRMREALGRGDISGQNDSEEDDTKSSIKTGLAGRTSNYEPMAKKDWAYCGNGSAAEE